MKKLGTTLLFTGVTISLINFDDIGIFGKISIASLLIMFISEFFRFISIKNNN